MINGVPEKSLFSLDLSKPFPLEVLIPTASLQNTSIPSDIFPDIEDQAKAPFSGALFATNDSLYIYGSGSSPLLGGKGPHRKIRHTLASYSPKLKRWTAISLSGGDYNGDARLWGQAASDPSTRLSFFTGGANNEQGMLRLNISHPDNVSWTNQTKGNGLSGVDVDVMQVAWFSSQ